MSTPLFLSAGFPLHPDAIATRTDLSLRFDVEEKEVDVGAHAFHMLMVRDTNVLLEGLDPGVFAKNERLPYWAELWPSSLELARYCIEETSLTGKTVLDLGCGLGLVGVAAAAAGARVIYADYEPDALLFAKHNARRNLPREIIDTRVEFRLLDWRSDDIQPVDMILGADLVYERKAFLPILDFVRRALKPDGLATFTDPDRSTGMAFFGYAEQQGFKVHLEPHTVNWMNRERSIILGELRHETGSR